MPVDVSGQGVASDGTAATSGSDPGGAATWGAAGSPGDPGREDAPSRAGAGRSTRAVLASIRRRPVLMTVLAVVAILGVVGIAGGLGGGSGSTRAASSAGPSLTQRESPSGAGGASSSAAGGEPAPAAVPQAGTSGGTSGGTSALPALPSRVIKTGSLDLQIRAGQLLTVINLMSGESTGLGGFVASSTTNMSTPGTAASGDITLRVPVQSFSALLTDVERLGRASSVTTSGQDVTSQYVDLQARIQSLQDGRSQFQQILTKAQSIGDILAVEQQISTLQTQIEELQGQLKVLDDQSSFSTLSVHVVEVTAPGRTPRPTSGLTRSWLHARRSFSRGLDSIVAFSGGFALFLVVVGFLAVVARFAWVLVRRRTV
jgi:hypothetical protein